MRLIVVRGPAQVGPFDLQEGSNHAGRGSECEVMLPSKRVSRRHAVFQVGDGRVVVKDLESHNGIIDDDGRRVAVVPLAPGGRVQIGDFLLMLDAPLAPTEDDLDLDSEEVSLEREDTAETSIPAAEPTPSRPIPQPLLAQFLSAPSRAPFPSSFAKGAPSIPPKARTTVTPPPMPLALPPPSASVASGQAPARSRAVPIPIPHAPSQAPPQGEGIPWMLQAFALLALGIGIVLLAPTGGLLAQISAGASAVEAADGARGEALAQMFATRNAAALSGEGTLDAGLKEEGVRATQLADARGVVLAPLDKRRMSIANHLAWQESSRTGRVAVGHTDDGLLEIVAPARTADGAIAGYASLEFDAAGVAASRFDPIGRAAGGVLVAAICFVLIAGGGLRLALHPFTRLREDTERALGDPTRDVGAPARVAQVEALAATINRVLATARAASGKRGS